MWRDVPGWNGLYEVSSNGQVRSRGSRILRPTPDSTGHLNVVLSIGGKRTRASVHRLVLLAFVGPCPDGMEGCHNNGDPGDNRLQNLRWDTRRENCRDRVVHGRHEHANKTECPRGHRYTADNTYYSPQGWRTCRACRSAHQANYKTRKKESQ